MISWYEKLTKPLKEVKQEQKPLRKISLFGLLIVLGIIQPYKKEPIIDTIKILFKYNLKKVARYATNNIIVKNFLFNF